MTPVEHSTTSDEVRPKPFSKNSLGPGSLLFIGVVSLQILMIFLAPDLIHLSPDRSDMLFYFDWAGRIASGQWSDGHAFYGLPGYAYFLAFLRMAMPGAKPFDIGAVAGCIQAFAFAGTAWAIYRIVRVCLQKTGLQERTVLWVAMGAGALWAFTTPARVFSAVAMPSVFAVLVFWIVVYWLVALSANEKTPFLGKLSSWGLMGLLLGFTAQFVATVLMLVPLALVALGAHAFHAVSAKWRMRGFAAVLLIAGVGVGTSPSWLHNTLVAREPVFLSAHEGINFFLGNHASSDGYTSIPAGLRRSQDGLMEDSLKLPEVETGRPMRRSECSAWWKARANRWIAENPDAWRALLIKKVANFWNIYEFDDLNAIAPWLEMGLVPPGFRFGHFAFLALAALPLVLYRCGPGRWVAAGVLMLSLAILPVFVTERYRLTALPGLIVLAVCGVTLCVTSIRTRRWVSVASVAIFAVPCALLVFAPRNSPVLIARIDHPVGLRLLERSQQVEDPGERQDLRRRGVERLRNAHKLLPRDSEIAFAYANGLLLDGKTGESEGLYRQILASLKDSQGRPTHLGAVNNLSMLLSQAKRHAEAEPLLERSLEIEPGEANTWMRLAEVRLALGKKDLAKAAVKEALRLRPGTQGYLQFEQKLNAAP